MLGERPEQTAARKARLEQRYPVEFGNADAETIMGIDAMRVDNGQAPSQFSMQAARLAAHAGNIRKKS